jgi:hypothetical protein
VDPQGLNRQRNIEGIQMRLRSILVNAVLAAFAWTAALALAQSLGEDPTTPAAKSERQAHKAEGAARDW